jgi:hypothetical protein
MMAFTRLIAGPMDYHLGGFRAVPRAQFKPRNIAPNVLGTRWPGRYTARIWKDASDAESDPNHLTTETQNVSAADKLIVRLALDGGFVAQLTRDPSR